MLKWLKRLTRTDEASRRADLPEALQDLLRSDFERLDALRAGISRRLLRFALDGDGEGVLDELAGLPNAAQTLELRAVPNLPRVYRTDRRARVAFFAGIETEDVAFLLRLAAIYDAAARNARLIATLPAFAGGYEWLQIFLCEVVGWQGGRGTLSSSIQNPHVGLSVGTIERMVLANGQEADILVRGALMGGPPDPMMWAARTYRSLFLALPGFAESLGRHPDAVREALRQPDFRERVHALEQLGRAKADPSPFAAEIVGLAVSPSKEVREAADRLIASRPAIFLAPLEQCATAGAADVRFHAAKLLQRHGGEQARLFLSGRLAQETSAKVADLIRQSIAAAPTAETPEPGESALGLAPVAAVDLHAPLPRQVLDDLRACLDLFQRKQDEWYETNKHLEWVRKAERPPKIAPERAPRLFEALQTLVVRPGEDPTALSHRHGWMNGRILTGFAAHPGLSLIHVVRWCALLGLMTSPSPGRYPEPRDCFASYLKAHATTLDLRELAAVFRAVGLDDRLIGGAIIQSDGAVTYPAPPQSAWPYFAEHPGILEEALGLKLSPAWKADYREKGRRLAAFRILAMFPHPPAAFAPMLWDLALGPAQGEREVAQRCLERAEDRERRIVAALADGQKERRAVAAAWLAELGCTDAVPALKAALAKEADDRAKGAIMQALEALGVPLDAYLDRGGLAKEAERGLRRGIPAELGWFPFDALPPVHWADSGERVPARLLQWFVVLAHKLKSPEPTPLLRLYCRGFRPADRAALGKLVLQAWIAQDTIAAWTPDEAAAKAEASTRQMAALAKQHPKFYEAWDEERYRRAALRGLLAACKGSAIGTKGLLALFAACGGRDVAPIVHQYVRDWYGTRAAQGKALVEALAWVDEPNATQVVLAIANRFRTKGIQEEAARQCRLLADRKGWTLDELADRTIPTAGFAEDGVLALDYGVRSFVARLGEDLEIMLENEDGKPIASLPEGNRSEDPALVKAAKAALAAARKELKTARRLQTDRLYEAMCTQRGWRFADWDESLNRHPIAGALCRRLVWTAFDGDRPLGSVRPLADRSLTDHRDDAVVLPPHATLRLAHGTTLPEADAAAWAAHFADYAVEPLFPQFGRRRMPLTDALKTATEITEFEGHMIDAFALRGRMNRLGYQRGAPLDGAWFVDYARSFQGIGIDAVVEFSGSTLPEEKKPVALLKLTFVRKAAGNGPPRSVEAIPLGEVPPVLLDECWNDLRTTAADGTGFAADWRRRVQS